MNKKQRALLEEYLRGGNAIWNLEHVRPLVRRLTDDQVNEVIATGNTRLAQLGTNAEQLKSKHQTLLQS